MRSLKELSPTQLQILVEFLINSKGISYGEIVTKVAEKFGVKVSKATVIRWYKVYSNPYKTY